MADQDHTGESALTVAVGAAQRHLDGGRHDRAAAVLSRHLSKIDPDAASPEAASR
jgi:hypothetical protein